MPKGHSSKKDFIGGMDPFGIYTTQYGQKAQQRKESEGSHRKRRAIATAGGVVGGSLLVPSAITGLIGGAKGVGGGVRGVARGVARGVGAPIRGIVRGRQAVKALRGLGKSPSQKQITKATETVSKLFPAEARVEKALRKDRLRSKAYTLLSQITEGSFHKRMAAQAVKDSYRQKAKGLKEITPLVEDAYRSAKSQLALGGAVGGGGAFIQYGKGRESERGFSKRQKKARRMKKTASTLQESFEDAVFYIAEHQPTIFQALDKLAYHVGSDAPEDLKEDVRTGEEDEEERKLEPGTVEKARRARKLLLKKEKGKKRAVHSETGVAEQPVSSSEEDPAEKVARLTRVAYLSH